MGLVIGFMLYVDGKPTKAVTESLEETKKLAVPYIDTHHEVQIETTYGLIRAWYYDRKDQVWVERPTGRRT